MSESSGGSASQNAPAAPTQSLTRGFLFADLRGYTSYIDRRGVTAAADLLQRFRHLVRGAVAVHLGAEIRTEGDSFYVVFPSASMAVACALDIVRAAGDEVIHRDDAIQVGVGVHAGEALDTPDGPVGTAVNIAARLCAMAGPGEVIVSDTVRALTRSIGNAGFVPLGRRPIKGLDESLGVYRAVAAGSVTQRPSRGRRRRVIGIAAVAGGGALALALLVLSQQPAAIAPSSTRSSTPLGQFSTDSFAVPFTITLGEGWSSPGDLADLTWYSHDTSPRGWIDVILVAATLDPPCDSSPPESIGGRPKDVIDWLTTRPWLDHGEPRPYNVGRYLGWGVEIEVPAGGRWTCPDEANPDVADVFRMGDPSAVTFTPVWGADVGERKRVVAIDVDGRTVTFVMGSPFTDVEKFWDLTAPLIQSIRFTGKTP